jgi:hypothetical protein
MTFVRHSICDTSRSRSPNISLSALKKNVRTFKFQTKEVFTDPKRVARRHWHRYMHEKRREQIMKDSFLFV